MKKFFSILVFQIAFLALGYGQVIPKGMNYQAVARNLKGEVIPNQKISFKIYLFGNENNQRLNHYSEIHEVTTNGLGLFHLIVGEGSREQGEYGLIPWNSENIWMEVAIKDKDQTDFATVSSNKLMAVPYAIYAGTADKLVDQNTIPTSSFAPPEPGVISTEWSVFGNAKTDASGNIFRTNSLGTTDFVDLVMITDNEDRMRILAGGDIKTKLNFEIGKNLNIGQNLTVGISATFGDSLVVKKNVLLNTLGGSTINCGPFTVAGLSPTLFTGILTVDKATDFNTTLNVDKSTNLNGRLTVTKMSPTKLTGTLVVDSTTNINDALNVNNMSPTYLSGTLLVDSMATFNDKIKILSGYQTDTTTGAPASGSLQVRGGAYVKENLYIGGVAKFGGPVAFAGAVSITDGTQSIDPTTGALKVSGGVGIGLNLNVGGAAMIGGMATIFDPTQSFNDSTGALKVLGGAGIRKRLNVGGGAWFGSTLNVNGITNLNNTLNVTNSRLFVAEFINMSDGNGLSIEIANPMPGWANRFVEFRGSNGVVGRIEGENASQYMLNDRFIKEVAEYDTDILRSQLLVTSTALDLAAAITGVVAAATSVTFCVGLGVCTTTPIISFTVKAVLKAALYAGAVAAVSYLLVSANKSKDDFLAYKMARIGVTYESGSADYAEWLPMANPEEPLLPGYIVAVKNGKITKNTEEFDKLLVVSTKPIILGNAPRDDRKKDYEKVAFMGQVPVHVSGKVNAGDYILPSGLNNGMGKAVSPTSLQADDYTKIVGVAWSASDKESSIINLGLGLNAGDISKVVIDQNNMIREFESKFNESNATLAEIVPGFKKSAKAAGIFENDVISQPAKVQTNAEFLSNLKSPGSIAGAFNLYDVSDEDILVMADLAIKSFPKDGRNSEVNELLARIKKDPGFKIQFTNDIRNEYKQAIQKEFEKWRPRQ